MAQIHQQTNPERLHIVDTFPLPVCRNIRIKRCHIYHDEAFRGYCDNANDPYKYAVAAIYHDEAFRGYCDSKKEYYFGLKVCVIVAKDGAPVEMLLAPASTADIVALRSMDLNLPEESTLIGDTGFLDREMECSLREEAGIRLFVTRRKNMNNQLDGCLQYICNLHRKRVENRFSLLAERLARSVHAETRRGFELKVFLTVLAFPIIA